MTATPQIHPLVLKVFGDPSTLPFEPGNDSMDGWYIWRLNSDDHVDDYKVLEVTGGVMMDTEPVDSYGAEFRVCEDPLYGEFFGPILLR